MFSLFIYSFKKIHLVQQQFFFTSAKINILFKTVFLLKTSFTFKKVQVVPQFKLNETILKLNISFKFVRNNHKTNSNFQKEVIQNNDTI